MKKLCQLVYHQNPAWALVGIGFLLFIATGVILIWQACERLAAFLFWMGLVIVVLGAILAWVFFVADGLIKKSERT